MIRMTESHYLENAEGYIGICTECKEETDSVEPDATNYKCPSCEKMAVCGTEQLLLIGEIEIIEGSEDHDA